MSPETVLLPASPATPQPSPLAAASVASPPPNAGDPAPPMASSGAQTEGASRARAASDDRAGSAGRSGNRRSPASRSPEAPRETRRTKAHPAGSAPQTAQSGANFSQTLAQSLAAHHPTRPAVDAGAGCAKPAAKDGAAHASAKDAKTDPVQSALVLVSHGIAAAPAPAANPANVVNAQGASVAGRETAPAVKALLAQALTRDAKAPTAIPAGPATTSPHAPAQPSPSNTAAALGATQLGVASHLATRFNAMATPAPALSAPVGTGAWTEELGARVNWMTHQGIQSASLHLSPENLGPLQVSISVHHGQASVWFGAVHEETRQALERSMPQLRQMLSNQGLTLTDSGVSRDSSRERTPQQGGLRAIDSSAGAAPDGSGGAASVRVGLVDAYA